jgi:hypothetical protein
MSAILNTLKKLEEEKSVFEQNLDVRDMALHEEFGSALPIFRVSDSKRGVIFISVGTSFLILLVVLFFFFKPIKKDLSPHLPLNHLLDNSEASNSKRVNAPKVDSVSGISMRQIRGERIKNTSEVVGFTQSIQIEPAAMVKTEESDVSKQVKVAEVMRLINLRKERETPAQIIAQTPDIKVEEENVLDLGQNIKEESVFLDNKLAIPENSLEQNLELPGEEILSLFDEGQINNLTQRIASESKRLSSIYLSSIKIKGIIFFSEGNPANYIFVSTPKKDNLKLKVGESFAGASLQSIQPDRAIFSKGGKTGFLEMGQ